MARVEPRFAMAVVLAMAVGMVVIVGSNNVGALAQQSCQGDVQGLTTQCMPYIRKGSPRAQPSRACCDQIKNTDVTCMCKHLSRGVEQQLDMDNVVYVTGYCGKPLSHGMQCGGYTVP